MATIRKRSGRWAVEVRVKPHPRVTKTFATKREATAWAQQEETRLRQGGSVTRETLSELIDLFKKGSEIDNYQAKVLRWWDNRLGSLRLGELRKADFLEARRALQETPKARGEGNLAPATVNRRMAAISAVLTYGIEEMQLLEVNPARVRSITENNERDRLLTGDERKRLLAACKAHSEPALYALVRTAMITGARAGELLALRWPDVDLDTGVIRITKNARRDTTKNSDTRAVPIAGEALELLKERKRTLRRFDNDLVFYNSNTGGVYHYRQHWAGVKKTACIVDFKFHDLRHQAASELTMAGVSLRLIGDMLGHRSAQMGLVAWLGEEPIAPL